MHGDHRLLVQRNRVGDIVDARFSVFLIGGFDGNRNYGDFLQLASILEQYRSVSHEATVLVVVEYEKYASLQQDKTFNSFPQAIPVFFSTDVAAPTAEADLVDLPQVRARCFHFYGGGYINNLWGARKRLMAEAVRSYPCLNDDPLAPPITTFSGVQVTPGDQLKDWAYWFRAASSIGVRDRESIQVVKDAFALPNAASVVLSGDDAAPTLIKMVRGASHPTHRVGIHINLASYSTNGEATGQDRIQRICRIMSPYLKGGNVCCDFLIAYSSDLIGERTAAEHLQAALEAYPPLQGIHVVYRYRDLYEECSLLESLDFDYSIVYACSYHVALSAALAGCATNIEVSNDYYMQKYRGLLDCIPHAKLSSVQAHEGANPVQAADPRPAEPGEDLLTLQHAAFLRSVSSIVTALAACDRKSQEHISRLEKSLAAERHVTLGYQREARQSREIEKINARLGAVDEIHMRLGAIDALHPRLGALDEIHMRLSAIDALHPRLGALEQIQSRLGALEEIHSRIGAIEDALQHEGVKIPKYIQQQIAMEVMFEKQRWGIFYKIGALWRRVLRRDIQSGE